MFLLPYSILTYFALAHDDKDYGGEQKSASRLSNAGDVLQVLRIGNYDVETSADTAGCANFSEGKCKLPDLLPALRVAH